MARRKASSDPVASGIILLGIILLVLPALLFVCWGILRFRLWKFRKSHPDSAHSAASFWLTDEEKSLFKSSCETVVKYKKEIKALEHDGDLSGLSRNKDGSFSARSTKGKYVSAKIRNMQSKIDSSIGDILYLQEKPRRSWNEYFSLIAKEKSALLGCVAFVLTGMYIGRNLDNPLLSFVMVPYALKNGDILTSLPFLLPMSGVTVITFIISYLFFYIYSKVSPPVPIVTYKNVDDISAVNPQNDHVTDDTAERHDIIIKTMQDFFEFRQGSCFKDHEKAASLWCTDLVSEKKHQYASEYDSFLAKESSSIVSYDISGLNYDVENDDEGVATVKVFGTITTICGSQSIRKDFTPTKYTLVFEHDAWKIHSISVGQ